MFKKVLGIRKLSTRELCTLAMLLSIAVLMGMFFTLRIGEGIKIPTKFLPIAIASMLFGPLWGGVIGAVADILAYFVNPVASFMPQITFVEFLYGFTYGLFLYNATRSLSWFARGYLCVIFQIVLIHFLLTSLFLMPVFGDVSYVGVLAVRALPASINLLLQLAGITFVITMSPILNRLSRGGLE